MASISELYQEVSDYSTLPPEYVEKQLHKIPMTTVVDRVQYLVDITRDKVVLDFGASGSLVNMLQEVAKEYHGIDVEPNDQIDNFYLIDLDAEDTLPEIHDLQLIVAGEVIEHLSNAGHFLDLIRTYYDVPVILTTPNAHSTNSFGFLKRGIENVNRDHVAWYSYHTLKVLIERHGFQLQEWYWYNGTPIFAEGIIFYMEPVHGND